MTKVVFFHIFVISLSSKILNCDGNRLTKHFPDSTQEVYVAGIFSENEIEERMAFEAAVVDVNEDASILKKTRLNNITKIVDTRNAFVVKNAHIAAIYKRKKIINLPGGLVGHLVGRGQRYNFLSSCSLQFQTPVCASLRENITVLFGPNSEEGLAITRSIANWRHIPYLFSLRGASTQNDNYSVNMFPSMRDLTKGIQKIIHDMDWNSFTLLYEDDQDLEMLQDLLIEHETLKNTANYKPIIMRRLPENLDYGPVLKEIHNKSAETRFVLRCAQQHIKPYLNTAQSLKVMGDYYAYVIISLDAYQLDFQEFAFTKTNITTISLINPFAFVEDQFSSNYDLFSNFVHEHAIKLKTQAFLVYDTVYLFAKALDTYLENNDLVQEPLSCEEDGVFENGTTLIDFIKGTEIKMVTDHAKIDKYGERSFHVIQIQQMLPHVRFQLGEWEPLRGITHSRNTSVMLQEAEDILINKTFTVSSILGEGGPFLRTCNTTDVSEEEITDGAVRYCGFSNDLIREIAKERKFKYKIVIAPDGQRGSYIAATGKWNGIIKEVQDRRADLGICDLTITHDRRKVVDFTKPFMTLGISILYKKGKEEETEMFSFLKPLQFQVWLCVATSLLALSIALFVVSRLSPYDWESSHPCDSNVEELENALSLVNSLWFSLGSVLQQGCDILPKALSSRIVASMWWFFTLIMVSTYTANLAAFLTTQQMDSEIKDVNQLASQSAVKYGCMELGSTATFFKQSKENLYQKIWATMESAKPSVFTKSNEDGRARVLRDKQYAFFMESSLIEYELERHCSLTQVGGLLDNKAYGIAMPLNSPYRTAITTALLKLQEDGRVKTLRDKWWTAKNDSDGCTRKKTNEIEENALAVTQVGGVFVVLIVGIMFSFILAILEFLWNIRKVAVIEKIPLKEAFQKELRFVLNCHISTKPVRKPSEKTSENNDMLDRFKTLYGFNASQDRL